MTDEAGVGEIRVEDGLVRARAHLMFGELDECDEGNGADCLSGYIYTGRYDVGVLLNPTTGQYISVNATSEEGELEFTDRLPLVRVVDGRVSA